MADEEILAFPTRAKLEAWLKKNHAKHPGIFVRIYKRGSGTPSVSWQDVVLAALCWGWIDSVKRSYDDASFLQRLTPRRAKSKWSKNNREHVERLIAEGLMQPSGLAHVEAAKKDGRWDAAYAGSANMEMPEEFLAELKKNKTAQATFDALSRAVRYSIYFKLHNAKRAETRQKHITNIIAQLAKDKSGD